MVSERERGVRFLGLFFNSNDERESVCLITRK